MEVNYDDVTSVALNSLMVGGLGGHDDLAEMCGKLEQTEKITPEIELYGNQRSPDKKFLLKIIKNEFMLAEKFVFDTDL